MTEADTEPTRPALERFPLGAVIVAAVLTMAALGGGIAFVWAEGWPIVGIAAQIVTTPVGAVLMYGLMARIGSIHDTTGAGQPPNPRALRRLIMGYALGAPVVGLLLMKLHLSAAIGFAGGIMLGLFWWMVRQRWAPAGA